MEGIKLIRNGWSLAQLMAINLVNCRRIIRAKFSRCLQERRSSCLFYPANSPVTRTQMSQYLPSQAKTLKDHLTIKPYPTLPSLNLLSSRLTHHDHRSWCLLMFLSHSLHVNEHNSNKTVISFVKVIAAIRVLEHVL